MTGGLTQNRGKDDGAGAGDGKKGDDFFAQSALDKAESQRKQENAGQSFRIKGG